MKVDVVYSDGAVGLPMHTAKTVPFSASVKNGNSDVSVACACPFVQTLECNISDGKIEIDISYMLIINAFAKRECELASDAYIPFYECDAEIEDISFSNMPIKSEKTLRISLCSDSALPDGSEILTALPRVKIESVNLENGGALGSASVSVIYKNADGGVSSVNVSDSFEIDLADLAGFDEYAFLIRVSSVGIKEGSDRLCAEYDLTVSIVAWKSASKNAVRALVATKSESSDTKRPFIVYYPMKDEVLWDVGKKYNLPVSSIASANPECEDGEILPKAILITRAKRTKK